MRRGRKSRGLGNIFRCAPAQYRPEPQRTDNQRRERMSTTKQYAIRKHAGQVWNGKHWVKEAAQEVTYAENELPLWIDDGELLLTDKGWSYVEYGSDVDGQDCRVVAEVVEVAR